MPSRTWVGAGWLAFWLTACGVAETPTPAASAVIPTDPPRATANLAIASPSPRPSPLPSPTALPERRPTLTAGPQADVKMTFTDCTWKFCPPSELQLIAINVERNAGILHVVFPDEFNVCLVYDPTRLTLEEAVRTFESSSGLEIGEILP